MILKLKESYTTPYSGANNRYFCDRFSSHENFYPQKLMVIKAHMCISAKRCLSGHGRSQATHQTADGVLDSNGVKYTVQGIAVSDHRKSYTSITSNSVYYAKVRL